MKLIIDIPEENYQRIKEYYEKNDIVEARCNYIVHGIPLEDIKAEIEDLEPGYGFEGFYKCQNEVLKIIDKHIGGKE